MEIELQDETETIDATLLSEIQSFVLFCAEEENVPKNIELSILFVEDSFIQQLNQQYREIDEPTDVLSFPQQENNQWKDLDIPAIPLGDIIISVDHAKKQATSYGHTFAREIAFLVVHGFLHLLGYDHMTAADEAKMFARQKKLLKEFGLEK